MHHRTADQVCTLANRAAKGRGSGLKIVLGDLRVSGLVDPIPRNPSSGASKSGSAISAFTPHATVVSPNRTSDEPSAVDIEPPSKNLSAIETD